MQALVKEEAKNLRKNLAPEEKNNLNFERLDPEDYKTCIYGLATGTCKSNRTSELITKCCSRVYKAEWTKPLRECSLNGKPSGQDRSEIPDWDNKEIIYWSPIEVFIVQKGNQENGNNKKLVSYLKGETNRLNFV